MRVLVVVMAPFEAATSFGGFSGLLKWSLTHAKQRQPHLYPSSLENIDQAIKFEEVKPCVVKNSYENARKLLPTKNQLLEENFGAIVLSGGSSMVSDREPWSEATAAWLREDAITSKRPIFGICYGHQLLAHALGGVVEYSTFGPQIGVRQAGWLLENPELMKDPVCAPLAAAATAAAASKNNNNIVDVHPQFDVLSIHHQTIVKLPPGTQVFASSQKERFQVVRMLENVYSTQFHGEYSTDYCKKRFDEEFGNSLEMNDEHLKKYSCGKFDTSLSASILARFLDYAVELEKAREKEKDSK